MVLILKRGNVRLEKMVLGPLSTNTYILVNYDGRALVIDAPPGALTKFLYMIDRGMVKLTHVLVTHAHFDHVAEAEPIKEISNAKLIMGRDDLIILNESERIALAYGVRWFKPNPDILLNEDTLLDLDWIKIYAFHTPGHSPGSYCYYIENLGVLFTGDVLFKDTVGRTDFIGGSSAELAKSLKKILLLIPSNTVIAPGHGELTTLAREIKFNQYLNQLIKKVK